MCFLVRFRMFTSIRLAGVSILHYRANGTYGHTEKAIIAQLGGKLKI